MGSVDMTKSWFDLGIVDVLKMAPGNMVAIDLVNRGGLGEALEVDGAEYDPETGEWRME